MADEEYITNMTTNDLDDNELPNKLKKAQDELIKMKAELEEKNKLCLTQKHTIEDLNIKIVNIDSCEYIKCYTYGFNSYVYSHKGNCKYCKERREKELKELVEQIKEK